ncbi:fumarate hydratase [Chloroflexota bacterium]
MREIKAGKIAQTVAQLCQEANFALAEGVLNALKKAQKTEESPAGKEVLAQILENARIAEDKRMPLCQDCGTAVVFLELGQEAHIVDGDLYQAIAEGVRQGYMEGYLRKSMASQPFSARVNTGDNTPPVIHTDIVAGDHLKVIVMPKGGGAENMARLGMLTPSTGREGIINLAVRTVDEAGANPCPPVIVGVGIGGTSEEVMLLAKRALLRRVGKPNPDPEVADLEREILSRVNKLGIGPMGLGGRTTALAVQAEVMPAHIACLPAAVNLQCHSSRHREAVL